MADQDGPAINANGIITTGRFTGQHVSNLAKYAENLEKELSTPAPQTGAQAPAQEEASPQDRLAQHSQNRISSVGDAASQRLELDDEAEFSRELHGLGIDYGADWKQRIDQIKSGMPENVRVAKGVHKMVYMQLRTQDPESFARLHNTPDAAPAVEEPEEGQEEAQEEAQLETAAAVTEEIKTAEPAKPKARAVTPAGVSPTPGTRGTAKKKDSVVPLQATSKVERLASEWGMTTEEYLKRVHARGVTQDDIERESVTRAERPGRVKSVFDRSTAAT
jgi:hypothetical protein